MPLHNPLPLKIYTASHSFHHLKILKEAGLVNARQEGTANYYYLTIADSTRILMRLGFMLEEYMDNHA